MPDSIITILRPGYLPRTPSRMRTQELCLVGLRLGNIVLEPIGRPADRARRHAILAAGMDGQRKLVALGCRIDRPEVAATQQGLALDQHQDRDETGVVRPPLDLLAGKVWRLHRQDDRCPEARISRQPFRRNPVVDGAAEGGCHIGIIDSLCAVEDIADGVRRAEPVEHLGFELIQIAARLTGRGPPIRSTGERQIGRIAGQIQPIDRTAGDLLLPVIIQIRQ